MTTPRVYQILMMHSKQTYPDQVGSPLTYWHEYIDTILLSDHKEVVAENKSIIDELHAEISTLKSIQAELDSLKEKNEFLEFSLGRANAEVRKGDPVKSERDKLREALVEVKRVNLTIGCECDMEVNHICQGCYIDREIDKALKESEG